MENKMGLFLFIGVLCAVVCYFLLNNGEDMKFYTVKVGEKESSYFVMEDVSKIIIEDVIETKVHNDAYLNKELIEVSLKDLRLDMNVLYCYDKKNGNKIDCKSFYKNGKKPIVEEQKYVPVKLTINKNDEELYSGEYREDLNTIIKEIGRYYFTVTYEEKNIRKIKTTNILFSVKVVK